MNIAELLVIATARNAGLDRISGGTPSITMEDVMYALATVKHEGAELLLRIKYMNDNTFIDKLAQKLWFQSIGLAKEEKWPVPNGKIGQRFLRNLGNMAIVEHISPHVCLRCGGVGNRQCTPEMVRVMSGKGIPINEGKIIECTPCRGTGRKKPTPLARAEMMGVHHEIWKRKWATNYGTIQTYLTEWEDLGIRKATARLRA